MLNMEEMAALEKNKTKQLYAIISGYVIPFLPSALVTLVLWFMDKQTVDISIFFFAAVLI